MDFSEALKVVKSGGRVARAGWNGRQPKTGFIPPSRMPVVYDGLCYILTQQGDVAYCDEEDYELVISHSHSWGLNNHGYVYYSDNLNDKSIALHKIIFPDAEIVDHANGNKLDNRRRNLRSATASQNAANRISIPGSSSKYKGVTWDKSRNKWLAACGSMGSKAFIGRFDDEEEAARAYDKRAKELHGDFAKLNFPDNSKMFIFLVPGSTFTVNREPLLSILGEGTQVNYHGHVDMRTANGQIVPWLCSQTDLLADDWIEV